MVEVDAGYKTPSIAKKLQDEATRAVMPYKRPMTPPGYFRKHEFVYDEYYDCYICPEDQILPYRIHPFVRTVLCYTNVRKVKTIRS